MKVKDVMSDKLLYLSPTDTVMQAAKLMESNDVGSIMVCEASNVVGIVTDRDITLRCTAYNQDPAAMKLSDIMTGDVVSVPATLSAGDAAVVMAREQVRRLPVMENGRVIGVLSVGDLARQGTLDSEVAMAISEISEDQP